MRLELDPYLNFHKNYRNTWDNLINNLNNPLEDSDIRTELTPFYHTKYYDDFSEDEKKKLFYSYIQFNAEVISFLERLLLISFRSLREDSKKEPVVKGVLKFMGEELQHSIAFTTFLHNQKYINFPQNKIVALPKWLVNWVVISLKWAPLGVCYPAVKLEAYSIAYWNHIKQYYKDNENDWVKLNHLHAVDELKHVPIHFEFIRHLKNKTKRTSSMRTIYATFVLIFSLQVTLFVSTNNMLKISLPRLSRFERLKYTFRMFKWILRELPVYDETRAITKKCFEDNDPPFRRLFSFMYW